MNAWMKNLTKEGDVTFPNGKKPEKLLKQIIEMTTSEGDMVLDSFWGQELRQLQHINSIEDG